MVDCKRTPDGFIVNGKKVEFSVPMFHEYCAPNGFLDNYLETHALFYYYLCAMRTYEEWIKEHPVIYEGHADPEANFHEIFKRIAQMYGVDPHQMANAWPQIDMQCRALGMECLPNDPSFRFTNRIQLLI